VGAGVAVVPPLRGRLERFALATYAAVACVAYGTVMNLWFWPFGAGGSTSVSYVPGAGLGTNLAHFVVFDLTTSLGFDLPRAAINAVAVVAVGGPVLAALRRSARRTVQLHPWELALDPDELSEPGSARSGAA
jgi:energy-coupling factor transport system substrate-specific component